MMPVYLLTCCCDTDWLQVWLSRLAEDEIVAQPKDNLHKHWNDQTMVVPIRHFRLLLQKGNINNKTFNRRM